MILLTDYINESTEYKPLVDFFKQHSNSKTVTIFKSKIEGFATVEFNVKDFNGDLKVVKKELKDKYKLTPDMMGTKNKFVFMKSNLEKWKS